MLVVPAIFLIGLQGAPLEVIGGAVEKSEIISRTTKALELHNKDLSPQVGVEDIISFTAFYSYLFANSQRPQCLLKQPQQLQQLLKM